MSPLGMVLGNLNSPTPGPSASYTNPSTTKENLPQYTTINLAPADLPTQNIQTTCSLSHTQFQLSILTRLKVSYHNNNHLKLDYQLVSKENKM